MRRKPGPSPNVRSRSAHPSTGASGIRNGAADYKPRYFGDIHARDAAYHQGTVWGWLIGPFIDAWLRVHPEDRQGARQFLEGFVAHIAEAGGRVDQ